MDTFKVVKILTALASLWIISLQKKCNDKERSSNFFCKDGTQQERIKARSNWLNTFGCRVPKYSKER